MNLFQKINEVMKSVESVVKNADIKLKTGGYKAVLHDDVTRLLHKPLANIGIVAFPSMLSHETELTQDRYGNTVYISNVWAEVTFINSENPEEKITTKCFAQAFDQQDKGSGKAYSMALKYCYLKTFMLESLENEEERLDIETKSNSLPLDLSQYVLKAGFKKGAKISDCTPKDLASHASWAEGEGSKYPNAVNDLKVIRAYGDQLRANK